MSPEQLLDGARLDRLAEMVALDLIAAVFMQECQLLVRLHPFGNHPHVELLPQGDHGCGNAAIGGILREVADEGVIDLQPGDRKILQRAQA